MVPTYTAFANLPDSERAIGKRIRAARTKFRLSQSRLAPIIGLTRDQLNNVEIGRVALRCEPGWELCAELDLNPLWLAFGEGQPHGFVDISGSEFFFGDTLFSQLMHDIAREDPLETWPGYAEYRKTELNSDRGRTVQASIEALLQKWLNQIKPNQRADFLKIVERSARDFAHSGRHNVNQELIARSEAVRIGSMKLHKAALWPRLRERIRKAVRKRGMKAALARDIGLSRQAINAVLTAKKGYRPSAEYTLRLREWVKAAEAHKNLRRSPDRPKNQASLKKLG